MALRSGAVSETSPESDTYFMKTTPRSAWMAKASSTFTILTARASN